MVFYPSPQDYKFLIKEILPRIREMEIDEALRGWNFDRGAVKPLTREILLGVWEVSNTMCKSFRDVWIRHKLLKKPVPMSPEQLEGFICHRIVSVLFCEARRMIYLENYSLSEKLKSEGIKIFEEEVKRNRWQIQKLELDVERLREKAKALIDFEVPRIQAKVNEFLSKYPKANPDSIATYAIPVFPNLLLDGFFLGLSRNLRADAVSILELAIFDLKLGRKRRDHKLQIAGYAMVFESMFERPVDVGCVVYLKFKPRIFVEREFFPITESLRAEFLELRDEKQRILLDQIEPQPQRTEACKKCAFKELCFPGS